MATVQPGSFLTLHYRLAGPSGDIINTFDGKPATLSLGSGELSPAVEQRLIGLDEGLRATHCTMSALRSPNAAPGGNSKVSRAPSCMPSRHCSTAGDSSPEPSDRVAGLPSKVLMMSPRGPASR